MPNSSYTKIYTGNYIIVQRIAEALEKIGINAVIKDETESGLTAVFGASTPDVQDVLVHNDELDKALQIVKNISFETES
tara:strand:+ start:33291 stop:33527 length:237 start_codon:yes stop_codon:yes gene_type:complete